MYQLKMLKFIKAAFDIVFDMISTVYYAKPLIYTRVTFQEMLVSHHQAVIVIC